MIFVGVKKGADKEIETPDSKGNGTDDGGAIKRRVDYAIPNADSGKTNR